MEAIEKSSKPETNIYSDARDTALFISAQNGKKYYPKQGASSTVNLSGI